MKFLSVQLATPGEANAMRALGLNVTGNMIKLALAPGDVRSAQELDSYLPGYIPFGGYRADEIAPVKLVDNDTDKYRVYGIDNVFRPVWDEVSLQSPVSEIDTDTTLLTYMVIPHALGQFVPAATQRQALWDVERAALRLIGDKLALNREIRVLTAATTLTSWATTARTTLGAGFQWNGGASSDPILDLQTRMQASAQLVTDIYMGTKAANAFLRHDRVRDHLRSLLGDNAPNTDILRGLGPQGGAAVDFVIPGIGTVHVAGGKVLNTTTGALDEIIGNDVILVSNPPGDPSQFESIRTMQTFRTRGPSGTGFVSRRFALDQRGLEGGNMLVSGYSEDVRFVANAAGGLIKSVIQ